MKIRKSRLERVQNTKIGRFLCRVLGEENGAVAMEYVIIGLLVAAAVVAIVMIFGNTISGMFGDMAKAMSGNPEGAAEDRVQRRSTLEGSGEGSISGAQATGKKMQTGQEQSAGSEGGGE